MFQEVFLAAMILSKKSKKCADVSLTEVKF